MADINFDCPHCGHNLEVSERGAGLTVACPECSKNIKIPIPAPELLMRDIISNCGSCGQPLKAAPDMAGQLIDCPACEKPTEIPFPSRPTPPTQTRPAAKSTPIPQTPSPRQVPGFGTSNLAAPVSTSPGFRRKTDADDGKGKTESSGTLAAVACVIGIIILAYYLLIYDTSVMTGMGRVVNIGLQQNRTLGVVVGVGLLIVAAILGVSRKR